MTEDRGTGRTSRQMKAAAVGATFVWCNDVLAYPQALARHLGRDDLRVVGASFAKEGGGYKLRGLPHVVIDHAQ